MLVRDVCEIFAKASTWIRIQPWEMEEKAYVATQTNNLLINYHTLRDVGRLGIALKGVIPDNIVLVPRGYGILGRP